LLERDPDVNHVMLL